MMSAVAGPSFIATRSEVEADLVSDESDDLETPLQVWRTIVASLSPKDSEHPCGFELQRRVAALPETSAGEVGAAGTVTPPTHPANTDLPISARACQEISKTKTVSPSKYKLRRRSEKRTRKQHGSRRAKSDARQSCIDDDDIQIDEAAPPKNYRTRRVATGKPHLRSGAALRLEKRVHADFRDSEEGKNEAVTDRHDVGEIKEKVSESPDSLLDTPDLVADDVSDATRHKTGWKSDKCDPAIPVVTPGDNSRKNSDEDDVKHTALDELFFTPDRISTKKPPKRQPPKQGAKQKTGEYSSSYLFWEKYSVVSVLFHVRKH